MTDTRLTKREISGLVGPLSGTASQILCVFFLAVVGQSFTGKELARMLGKSANTISAAMQQLESQGWLQNNGKNNGWSLQSKYHQASLLDWMIQENLDHRHNMIQEYLDQVQVDPKKFGSTPPLVVSSSSYSSKNEKLLTTTSADDPKKFGSTRNQTAGSENTAPGGPENTVPVNPENTVVADWLLRGGVAAGSPKWAEIVALDLAGDFVKAHVLNHLYEAQEWERERRGRRPGTGTLIYRLKKGWPAPPMRCEECLEYESRCRCGHSLRSGIPDEYKDIIKR